MSMTLEQAKKVIRDDSAGLRLWVIAASVLTNISNSENVSDADLLACLKRPGPCKESASGLLHRRTGRPKTTVDPLNPYEGMITDPNDWNEFLERTEGAGK
jgi:hypothetical protein